MVDETAQLVHRFVGTLLALMVGLVVPYAVILGGLAGGGAALDAWLFPELRTIRFVGVGLVTLGTGLALGFLTFVAFIGLWRGTVWGWALGVGLALLWVLSGCAPCGAVALVALLLTRPVMHDVSG